MAIDNEVILRTDLLEIKVDHIPQGSKVVGLPVIITYPIYAGPSVGNDNTFKERLSAAAPADARFYLLGERTTVRGKYRLAHAQAVQFFL